MRPTRDAWLLDVARLTARRTTCLRRAVGAVLADAQGRILATGYNGVARGMPHCNEEAKRVLPCSTCGGTGGIGAGGGAIGYRTCDTCGGSGHRLPYPGEVRSLHPHACAGASAPSGTNLDGCEAIHAEQNALLQVSDPDLIDTCYVTCSPCVTCTKLLLNTGCKRIVFAEPYTVEGPGKALWLKAGRAWVQAPPVGDDPTG